MLETHAESPLQRPVKHLWNHVIHLYLQHLKIDEHAPRPINKLDIMHGFCGVIDIVSISVYFKRINTGPLCILQEGFKEAALVDLVMAGDAFCGPRSCAARFEIHEEPRHCTVELERQSWPQ